MKKPSIASRVGPSNSRFIPRLTVRASRINGRGLFPLTNLPARRKIGELHGELVKLPQARKAIESAAKIYFIELSRRLALDCSQGNHFKYLNHSCCPNCYLRVLQRRVEVYTLQRISSGTELTVDYGETPHRGGMKCRCGADNCKGLL
ncbi:MAG TPA: SET domain-containing protein [Methylomirabilota bacterium]|nr:SET domain-containing protein [Methylomirabilota bacterium]